MKRILTSLTLVAMTFAVAPQAAPADDGVPFKGSFAVAFAAAPNPLASGAHEAGEGDAVVMRRPTR
jgi:hypothetical protein